MSRDESRAVGHPASARAFTDFLRKVSDRKRWGLILGDPGALSSPVFFMVLYPYLGHQPHAHGIQESISAHLQSKQQMVLGTTLLPGKMGLKCLGPGGVLCPHESSAWL